MWSDLTLKSPVHWAGVYSISPSETPSNPNYFNIWLRYSQYFSLQGSFLRLLWYIRVINVKNSFNAFIHFCSQHLSLMLLNLYNSGVHFQAVLCSNLLVVCRKLEDYKVVVSLLVSSWKFVEKKRAKTIFSNVSFHCRQLPSGCDFWFLLPALVHFLKSTLRKISDSDWCNLGNLHSQSSLHRTTMK